ncbi:MAG TPA: peptide ABC transporter substrate-binding protein [Rhizomicrobium sp.]|nr:peptide ABC transporter substrate-binding protein [Rhizomicrobium sp.]
MIRLRVALSTFVLLVTATSAHALAVLNRGNGSEAKSLDPAFVNTVAESNILGDLLTGLTTLDAAAHPIPGVAERWDVAQDGKTWTFHLRKSLWSDGKPVTAQDFVFAWQRELDPKTAAPYAYNLWVLKNARAISTGKMPPPSLGVRAADDSTLVVQLEHPASYLPELLTHDTAYPVPRHVVLAKGNAWARVENFIGNGAYVPAEWVLNDHLALGKNPHFYDAAHVRIDRVNYFPAEDSQSALNRFRAHELDTQSPIPSTSIDWLRKNMPNALRTAPFLATSYFALNLSKPPLNDVRVRKALNLAFDREAITDKVLRLGDRPAYGIVPPGIANFPGGAAMDFKATPMPARIALAQALMQQAGYGAGNRLHLVLETTHDPDNRRVAAAMQAMLRAVFVDLEIQQVDLQIHYRNMQIGNYEIASAVWIADFNDASNFLDLLRGDSGNNYPRYKNRAYDAAMDLAQQEPDAAKRGQLLLSAEKIALKDYPWLPWRFRVTQDLVQPYVKGWIPNARDYNRTRWLWVEPRPSAH